MCSSQCLHGYIHTRNNTSGMLNIVGASLSKQINYEGVLVDMKMRRLSARSDTVRLNSFLRYTRSTPIANNDDFCVRPCNAGGTEPGSMLIAAE